jgi:hypothetical protein
MLASSQLFPPDLTLMNVSRSSIRKAVVSLTQALERFPTVYRTRCEFVL